MIKWHKGPPPSIGWWPASLFFNPKSFRWWDGEQWSLNANEGMDLERISQLARKPSLCQEEIEWTDRPHNWPERSKT
jgi:hypothetical protein